MSEEDSVALVFDATVLSNFASSDSLDWLTTEFDQIYTIPAVWNKIVHDIDTGHEFLKPAQTTLDAGKFQIAAIGSALRPLE